MKQLLLAIVVLFSFAVTSCKQFDELLSFHIEEEQTIEIPASPVIGQVVPVTPITVDTNSSEEFKNNKTRAELVKDVVLNKLELNITSPQGENFNFLKKVEIYISAEGKGETKVAYLDEVPQDVSTITLKTTNSKLDQYIKGDTYTISTRATLAKAVAQKVTINAKMRFKVTADPL
ncbi:hypothetical protein ACSX1A_18180 [Pontibacter sp. MBLB2868]|uniref:hypothetical protein n=1 Tax=Pontibacter sp. MBLB2868 TaxID=3451555 RepID=UPI003F756CBE